MTIKADNIMFRYAEAIIQKIGTTWSKPQRAIIGNPVTQETFATGTNLPDNALVWITFAGEDTPSTVIALRGSFTKKDILFGRPVFVRKNVDGYYELDKPDASRDAIFADGLDDIHDQQPIYLNQFMYGTLHPVKGTLTLLAINAMYGVDWVSDQITDDFLSGTVQDTSSTNIVIPTTNNQTIGVLVQVDAASGALEYKQSASYTASLSLQLAYKNGLLPEPDSTRYRIGYFELVAGITEFSYDNIWSVPSFIAGIPLTPPFSDTTSLVEGSADITKELRIEVDGLTTATIRTWTAPDADLTIAGEANTATFTNKTVSASSNTVSQGTGSIKTISSGVASAGTDRNLIIAAESGTADDLIEITGLAVGETIWVRADTGDTITVKHNDAGATVKIHLLDDADAILDELNALVLRLVASNVLVQDLSLIPQPALYSAIAILQDQKTDGTDGGGSSASTWNNRDINTEVYDPDGIVTIASNQFTPIAGTYEIFVTSPHRETGVSRLRLWNVTASAVVAVGQNSQAIASLSVAVKAILTAVFTANGTDAYRIDMWTAGSHATNGFGTAVTDTGSVEIYTEIILRKLN